MAKKVMIIVKKQAGGSIKESSFKSDSTNFRKDQKAETKGGVNLERQSRMGDALKKYGSKKLTGNPTTSVSDMSYKKKGGTVKSKKK